jgi:pimeloyl-ACP methyl ester carboxylesterase
MGPEDAGETVLYLHGWGGSKELWWNTLTALSSTVRGVALDLPGTGDTLMPSGLRSMSNMARWVYETCKDLSLDAVTLVGHSLGGNLAAQVALEYPALAKRLVLVNAALEPQHFPPRSRWPLSERHGLTALRLARWGTLPLALAGRRVRHTHRGGHWGPLARRMHWYVSANTDAALQVQIRALCDNNLSAERLAALRLPLLIAHGKRDRIIPVERAHALASALPHARLAVFPMAHHCPMDTDPPGFAHVLREFISD